MTTKMDNEKQNDRISKLEMSNAEAKQVFAHIKEQLTDIKDMLKDIVRKEHIVQLEKRVDDLESWKSDHETAFRDMAIKVGAVSSSVAIISSLVLSQISQ